MAGLLREFRADDPLDRARTKALIIRGEAYTNAAAKFWPSFIDEIHEEHPACSMVELTAPTARALDSDQLHPEQALQRNFDQLLMADMGKVMQEVVAEMELLGPPCAVLARLFQGREEMLSRELPLDSVDAETFGYLVAWHLQWASVPPAKWNDSHVSGSIVAEDRDRARVYPMIFSLTNKHLSEGLYRRSLSFVPSVKPA